MTEEMREVGPIDVDAASRALVAEVHSLPDRIARLQGKRLYQAVGLLLIAALIFRFFDPISRVMLLAFVGIVLAVAMDSIVQRLPMRRGLGAIVVAVSILALVSVAIWIGGRWILPQLRALFTDLPAIRSRVEEWEAALASELGTEIELVGGVTETLLDDPAGTAMSLLTQAFGVLELVGLGVLVFFGAIFAVAKPNEHLLNPLLRAIPRDRRDAYRRMLSRMAERLVGWLRGTVISMLIIGAVSALAFWIIGTPYPFLLGAWLGLTEIIPIVGPWIGGVTAILVTLIYQPDLILWVVLAIVVIQQIEGNLIHPFVMSGAAELHPFVTLIGLLLFGTMFGLLGALLALPLLLAIGTAIEVLWIEETIGTADDDIQPMVEDA